MPYVKWRRGKTTELSPEDKLPVGRNVLNLTNVELSDNYTCIAASSLGMIEATTFVKVLSECYVPRVAAVRYRFLETRGVVLGESYSRTVLSGSGSRNVSKIILPPR